MRRALLLAAALSLALPGSALAHATLSSTSPDFQSSVQTPPTQVRLRFDQVVSIVTRSVEVLAPSGKLISAPPHLESGGRVIVAPIHGARRGLAYTVRWRALSSDGHIGAGVFTFGVGIPAPSPTEAVGASGITWKDDAARWGAFVTLAFLLGGLGLRLLVLRGPVPPSVERRFYFLAVIGAFGVIDVGVLAFILRAANALQLPFVDLMFGNLEPFATKTRFGIAFLVMTFGFAVVAAFVLISWILDRPWLLWPAFALALVLASGFSLSGHQATEPNTTWATELADYLHLIAASLWAGGLVTLAVCVWPVAPELRSRAFLGFSQLATVLVAVLVLAGTYLGIVRLPDLSDLWTTSYGHVLLAKVSIVCVALSWGAAHHFLVRPRLERGEAPSGLRRSLLGESVIAMLVLLAAAVLVNGAPPPVEPTGPARQATSAPR